MVRLFRGKHPKRLKVGDTVQCHQTEVSLHLTDGKCYEVLGFDGIRVQIKNDIDTLGWYQKSRFIRVKVSEGGTENQ